MEFIIHNTEYYNKQDHLVMVQSKVMLIHILYKKCSDTFKQLMHKSMFKMFFIRKYQEIKEAGKLIYEKNLTAKFFYQFFFNDIIKSKLKNDKSKFSIY